MFSFTFKDGRLTEAILIINDRKMPLAGLDPSRKPQVPLAFFQTPLAVALGSPEWDVAVEFGSPVRATPEGWVPDRPSEDKDSELYQAALNAVVKQEKYLNAEVKLKIVDEDLTKVNSAYRTATVNYNHIRGPLSLKEQEDAVSGGLLAYLKLSCLCKFPVVVEIRQLDKSDDQILSGVFFSFRFTGGI